MDRSQTRLSQDPRFMLTERDARALLGGVVGGCVVLAFALLIFAAAILL